MPSENNSETLFESFRSGFEANRLAHAYLVVGSPRGDAQAFAERVVQLLFCASTDRPCGVCGNCAKVRGHALPDVVWIEPQKKSQQILVEQIRDVQHLMYQTSFSGGWKVCVLIRADRMGDAAANAFLKTLEEPPGRSLFLLLTDSPHAVLPTILSRCQRVTVSAEQGSVPEELWNGIRDILVAPPAGHLTGLIQARRLLKLLGGLRKAIEEEEEAGAERAGAEEDTVEARVNARYKEARTAVVRAILLWHRDVLLRVSGLGDEALHYRSREDIAAIQTLAASTSYAAALEDIRSVERFQRQLEMNVPEESVFELGFGSLSRQSNRRLHDRGAPSS